MKIPLILLVVWEVITVILVKNRAVHGDLKIMKEKSRNNAAPF